MKVTLDKSGSFNTWFTSQGHEYMKCGAPMTAQFAYDVRIEGNDDKLSPEGFLIENGRIQEYFDKTYKTTQPVKSCELIACGAAKGLAGIITAEGTNIDSVMVTIHGTPGAKLTAVWTKPKNKKA